MSETSSSKFRPPFSSEMVHEPNKSKSTLCRICHAKIHDDDRIKVYGTVNAWGSTTQSYFHVNCIRELLNAIPKEEK